ncbi:unnamed protein product, partial [Ectocarpus sp. 13 AM-2016]
QPAGPPRHPEGDAFRACRHRHIRPLYEVFLLLKALWSATMFVVNKIKARYDLIRDDEYLVGLE